MRFATSTTLDHVASRESVLIAAGNEKFFFDNPTVCMIFKVLTDLWGGNGPDVKHPDLGRTSKKSALWV